METIPQNCITCPYERDCNTALNLPDCRFYDLRHERISFVEQVKSLFGKIFN